MISLAGSADYFNNNKKVMHETKIKRPKEPFYTYSYIKSHWLYDYYVAYNIIWYVHRLYVAMRLLIHSMDVQS